MGNTCPKPIVCQKCSCPICDCNGNNDGMPTGTMEDVSGSPWYFFFEPVPGEPDEMVLGFAGNKNSVSGPLHYTSPDFVLPDPPNLTREERTFTRGDEGSAISTTGEKLQMDGETGNFTFSGSTFTLQPIWESFALSKDKFVKNLKYIIPVVILLVIFIVVAKRRVKNK